METGLTFLVIGTWLSVSVARTGWVRRVWHSRSYLFVCSRMNCLFVANDVWKILRNVFQVLFSNWNRQPLLCGTTAQCCKKVDVCSPKFDSRMVFGWKISTAINIISWLSYLEPAITKTTEPRKRKFPKRGILKIHPENKSVLNLYFVGPLDTFCRPYFCVFRFDSFPPFQHGLRVLEVGLPEGNGAACLDWKANTNMIVCY